MKQKTKLLVVTTTFPRWKDDTDPPFVYELSRRFQDLYDVHVLTPHYKGSLCVDNLDGIKVYRYRYFLNKYEKLAGGTSIIQTIRNDKLYLLLVPFLVFSGFISLLLLSLRLRPAVIHAHWAAPQGILALVVKFFLQVKVVITIHGSDAFLLNSSWLQWLRKYIFKYTDHITFVSQSLFSSFTKNNYSVNSKCTVLPMGVDSNKFFSVIPGTDENRTRLSPVKLLFVGRLTEIKGVSYLLDCCHYLKEKEIDYHLKIVGSGEIENDLKSYSINLGLEDKVSFLGAIENESLPEIYQSHHIFIGPSITMKDGATEGFGITFIEAGMSGCLLIGTNSGGIKDIIRHEQTGFLVNEKDGKAIGDIILMISKQPERYLEITEKCVKDCIEKYDWKVISKSYKRIFQVQSYD